MPSPSSKLETEEDACTFAQLRLKMGAVAGTSSVTSVSLMSFFSFGLVVGILGVGRGILSFIISSVGTLLGTSVIGVDIAWGVFSRDLIDPVACSCKSSSGIPPKRFIGVTSKSSILYSCPVVQSMAKSIVPYIFFRLGIRSILIGEFVSDTKRVLSAKRLLICGLSGNGN